jgi:uncharacterized protein (TIGR00369 family)
MRYIDAIKEQGRDANPFFTLMGIEVVSFCEGQGTIRMNVMPSMTNGEGWLQGGIFSALADEAMVLAIYPLLEKEETIATISETTQFFSGVREGALLAEGTVMKRGRRVVFAEGFVREEKGGKVLSRTSATFAVIPHER